ncbi:MAG: tetratricopeptide repeat protein [bacterium]
MTSKNKKVYSRRQIRFAEAGVMFVLILGVITFIGVKIVSNGTEQILEPDAVVAADQPSASIADVIQPGVLEVALIKEPVPATNVEPEDPPVISYAEAEAAYFEARFADAAELFSLYTDQHPKNAWGHYMLGLSCWKDGCPDASVDAFNTALSLKPDHIKSLVNLGRVYLEMDRPQDALPLLEEAVAIDSEYVDSYRVLGRVYHNLDQTEAAVTAYRNALRRNENDAWSLNNLGLLHIQAQRFPMALPPLAKAVMLRDDVACFQNNLGIALENSGQFQAAADAYMKALDAQDDYAKAEVNLTRVAELENGAGLEPFDLAATAEQFTVIPLAPVVEVAAPVASTTAPLTQASESEEAIETIETSETVTASDEVASMAAASPESPDQSDQR